MKILLVDDERSSREAVRWFLQRQEHEVTECSNGEDALLQLSTGDYPMVLSDIRMPGMSGTELAIAIKQLPNSWRTDIVLFTGYGDTQTAVAALRAGVYDYLQKPVDAKELASLIERIAEHQTLLRENRVFNDRFDDEVNAATEETRHELFKLKQMLAESVVGKVGVFSESMRVLYTHAQKFHTDRLIPVLIEGETGTGKEIIAKVIHYGIGEVQATVGNFVDINCAALAANLFESELFGYEPGAFTGGITKGQKGKFDLAQGGTLFLDEVGEIPLELQGKLLRVLQEKEYYRVGGLKKIKTDVRVICATNVSLEERVEAGTFRRDLYFRLKVGQITIPPLRARKEEIVSLAEMFLHDFAKQKGKKFTIIQAETAAILEQHSWPGNVRELKNVIEYATFAYDEKELKPWHVIQLIRSDVGGQKPVDLSTGEGRIVLPQPIDGYPLKQYTDDIIKKILEMQHGNQTATARYLGMSLRGLTNRLEQQRARNNKSVENG